MVLQICELETKNRHFQKAIEKAKECDTPDAFEAVIIYLIFTTYCCPL